MSFMPNFGIVTRSLKPFGASGGAPDTGSSSGFIATCHEATREATTRKISTLTTSSGGTAVSHLLG
jgi:hypothetical protein